MEESGAKVLLYALLAVLLLQFSSLVGAVDIVFFPDPYGCSGNAIGCYGIGPNVCCYASQSHGGSVLVNNAGSSVLSQIYRNGRCKTYIDRERGNVCYLGGEFTGAFWYHGRRRSLLADSTKCDTEMMPNSVFFTEDSTKGHWVLTTSDVDELFKQIQTVPDAEKVNWLKALGAFYKEL